MLTSGMRGWSDYFFMVGSAAAALIGLMFVVVTLTAGRDRSELEPGKKLYTTPIVWHLCVVVVLSGAAVAPDVPSRWLGIGTLTMGVIGVAYSAYLTIGILRAQLASSFSGYDAFWYGAAPGLLYGGVAGSGLAMLQGLPWAVDAFAALVMGLLLVSIHNEWDLVTFLAPDAPSTSGSNGEEAQ